VTNLAKGISDGSKTIGKEGSKKLKTGFHQEDNKNSKMMNFEKNIKKIPKLGDFPL